MNIRRTVLVLALCFGTLGNSSTIMNKVLSQRIHRHEAAGEI